VKALRFTLKIVDPKGEATQVMFKPAGDTTIKDMITVEETLNKMSTGSGYSFSLKSVWIDAEEKDRG
jgi:hypothetical protein